MFIILFSLLLWISAAAAQEEEPLKEVTATTCIQDMSCEREAVDRSMYKSVQASSTLKGTGKKPKLYQAANAVDDREDTAWCEGKKGSGLGERLVIKLKKPVTVDGVLVAPMYAKSMKVAAKNNQVTVYVLDFGSSAIRVNSAPFTVNVCGPPPQDCTELNAPQQVAFPPVKTDSVTLTIKHVEHGKKYDDTCISTFRLLKPDTR